MTLEPTPLAPVDREFDGERWMLVFVREYEWRGAFDNAALNSLHAEGFEHGVLDDDWRGQVNRHSLAWVCAWDGDDHVGFVNVPPAPARS